MSEYNKIPVGNYIPAILANKLSKDYDNMTAKLYTHRHDGTYLGGRKLTNGSFDVNYPDFLSIPLGAKKGNASATHMTDGRYDFITGGVFYYYQPYTDLDLFISAIWSSNPTETVIFYINFYEVESAQLSENEYKLDSGTNDYGVMQLQYQYDPNSIHILKPEPADTLGTLANSYNKLIAVGISVETTQSPAPNFYINPIIYLRRP